MNVKTIIFDFDGTLVNSTPAIVNTIKLISKKYDSKEVLSKDLMEELKQSGVKEVFKKFKVPWYKIPFYVRDYWVEYNKEIPFLKPIDSIGAVIYGLKARGCKIGLVTANSKANVIAFLQANNLDVFDFIFADIGIFGKGTAIKNILRKNKVLPEDVVYIGDEIRDIEAARKIGIKVISVSWGLQARQALQKQNPDFLIDKPNELLTIIKKL